MIKAGFFKKYNQELSWWFIVSWITRVQFKAWTGISFFAAGSTQAIRFTRQNPIKWVLGVFEPMGRRVCMLS
jgi:hypothetical protein